VGVPDQMEWKLTMLENSTPETLRELEQVIAFRLGWRLHRTRVAADSNLWATGKWLRGPKWFVQPPHESIQCYVYMRLLKEEALEDLPHYYSDDRVACFKLLRASGVRVSFELSPREMLYAAAQQLAISLEHMRMDQWKN